MSVVGRYVSFIPDPAWSEEVVLTCMSYMAVHFCSTGDPQGRSYPYDRDLTITYRKKVVTFLDILADVAVLVLAVIMITVGWKYATGIGSKGTYVSMPKVSRFWMYFPVPLAGVAMVVFEIEALYNHVKKIFVKEEAK